MNKEDLINAIAAKLPGATKKDLAQTLNATIEAVSEALGKGEPVQLIGFGTFVVRKTEARKGRNPSNNSVIDIPAGKKVSFKVGAALKATVAA